MDSGSEVKTDSELFLAWTKAEALVGTLRQQLKEAIVIEQQLRRQASIALIPDCGEKGLSRREQEVYEMVLDQKTNKEIAWELNISVRTVKFHISNLLGKYRAQSRVDLILGNVLQQRKTKCP